MNILIITWNFPPQYGGISTYIEKCAFHLSVLGHNVTVLAPGKENNKGKYKYKVIRYKQNKILSSIEPTCKTINIILREKIEIVLLGHAMATTAFGALVLKRFNMIKLAIMVQGYDLVYSRRGVIDKWVSNLLFKYADILLPNSEYVKKLLVNKVRTKGYIYVSHPGVDLPGENNNSCEKSSDTINCLTVCNLVSGKGLTDLIKAFDLVVKKHSNAHLNIVGKGPLYDELLDLIKALKLENKVTLTGSVEDTVLKNYYCKCNLFVLASTVDSDNRCEGYGIVLLEAASYGKPVIGTRSGGIPETFINGITGLLVKPNNPDAVAQAIIKLINDKELRINMGRNGRERVKKELVWEKIIINMCNVFESIVNK